MRLMEINKRPFYYSLYKGNLPILDDDENETGEYRAHYSNPIKMRANISRATGEVITAQFGRIEDYDKVILIDDMSCPIVETSALFIDKEPEFDDHGVPLGDYIVRRVAKSLNAISYAVTKVDVS